MYNDLYAAVLSFGATFPIFLPCFGCFLRAFGFRFHVFCGARSFKLRSARSLFMEQAFGRGDHGFGVEAPLRGPVAQKIGDGHQAHALVMRQPAALDLKFVARGEPRRREIRRFVESIRAQQARDPSTGECSPAHS